LGRDVKKAYKLEWYVVLFSISLTYDINEYCNILCLGQMWCDLQGTDEKTHTGLNLMKRVHLALCSTEVVTNTQNHPLHLFCYSGVYLSGSEVHLEECNSNEPLLVKRMLTDFNLALSKREMQVILRFAPELLNVSSPSQSKAIHISL